jgi:hypothetical protein
MRLVFLALMFACFSAFVLCSTVSTGEEGSHWIFNSKKAPVVLSSGSEREYSVENVSDKHVTSYQLGCVRSIRGEVALVRIVNSRRVEWGPGEGETVMTTGQPEPRGTCRRLDSLVAVTHVAFSDGTSWEIARRRGSQ